MQTKSFLLSKEGEVTDSQDFLKYDPDKGLFAVADGVSNSFHPELVARILCEKFVSINPEEIEDWLEIPAKVLQPEVKKLWQTEIDEYLASISGRPLRHEMYNYDIWKVGASTFCGIHYDRDKGLIKYAIIGDSTLFLVMADGSVKEFNTSKKLVDDDGNELTDYSNTTEAVLSNGHTAGEWLFGEIQTNGVETVALMTDGIAKWFQKKEAEGQHPDQILWNIETPEDFNTLAESARKEGDMDDDLSVILIHIEDQIKSESPDPEELHEESVQTENTESEPEVSIPDESQIEAVEEEKAERPWWEKLKETIRKWRNYPTDPTK